MQKSVWYQRTHFKAEVILEALRVYGEIIGNAKLKVEIRTIGTGSQTLQFDSEEEFFSEIRRPYNTCHFRKWHEGYNLNVYVVAIGNTLVEVEAPNRAQVEKVFAVFDSNESASKLPVLIAPKTPTKIFIGHGHSESWKELKDHLHEKHDFNIEAYEIGARAGHTIRDILESMLSASSLAVVVFTGEDATAEGGLRARQNVVHELGLFQGRLGFSKAFVVSERGVELFSNLDGIQRIEFAAGNIRETFGDVLAALKREGAIPLRA